jgi:hypothetical protein
MRKAVRIAAVLSLVVATWVWGPMPRASAELDQTTEWGVSARADAMAVEYINTSSPVFGAEPVIYGTPASAASLVDSVGQSTAWAAAPYPGDIMVGAADNGNGALVGAGLPGIFASYPFYVETNGSQDKVQDQSGNRLVAHSEQYMSSSDARSGLITGDFLAALQAQAATRSSVDPATGELVGVADSRLDAFRFTDKLQIGRSVAHAKVTKATGQELVKESSFTIGSIIVNGVEMSYGDGGFKFGDQAPSSPGDPKPLFDALKAAGITVEILPATGTENSIESAGMKISQATDYGSGQQRISFIIGRVSAAIRGEAKPATEDPLFSTLPGTGTTGSESFLSDTAPSTDPDVGLEEAPLAEESGLNVAAGFSLDLPAGPDLSLPVPSGGTATVPPIVAAVNPNADANANAQAAAPQVRLASPASIGRGLRDDDISGFYLGVGGLAVLLTAAAFILAGGRKAAGAAATRSLLKLPNS